MNILERLEEIVDFTGSTDAVSMQSLSKGFWLQPMNKVQLGEVAEKFGVQYKKSFSKKVLLGVLCADPRVQAPVKEAPISHQLTSSSSSSALSSSSLSSSSDRVVTNADQIHVVLASTHC
jgi:hypothetical protein